jgi:hypothetical protein
MRRRPNEPDNEKVALAVVLFILGLFCVLIGVQVYRSPSFLPFQVNPLDRNEPPFGTVLLCIAGVVLVRMAGKRWRDSRPIPSESIVPPVQPVVGEDFPWRKATSLRFLDRKIESFEQIEEDLVEEYNKARDAYEKLPHSSGRIEYDRLRKIVERQKTSLATGKKSLAELRRDIEAILSGDVRKFILTIDEQIKKLQRNRQDIEAKITERKKQIEKESTSQKANNGRDENEAYLFGPDTLGSLRWEVTSIDHEIIELETDLHELKTFDFQKLYQQLGLPGPAALSGIAIDHLQDIKAKADILNDLKGRSDPTTAALKIRDRTDVEADLERLSTEDTLIDRNPTLSVEDKIRRRNINADKRERLYHELSSL